MSCPLCNTDKSEILKSKLRTGLFKCLNCFLIYVAKEQHLTLEQEKRRYELHQNSIENSGYVDFLNQALFASKKFIKKEMKGLDYGCGPNPVLSELLAAQGFKCVNYDPYFFDIELKPPYDYIFSTECFEHFVSPERELLRIKNSLSAGGILIVMTSLYDDNTDFNNWYYLRDATHISFYCKETFDYIAQKYDFKILEIGESVVIFRAAP